MNGLQNGETTMMPLVMRDDLLFIDVNSEPSAEPVKDWITAKVRKLMRDSKPDVDGLIRGIHFCECGATIMDSDGYNPSSHRLLPDGTRMSCLALHYVEHHRSDIPQAEINKLVKLMGVEPPQYPKWIPISVELPKHDQLCLVLDSDPVGHFWTAAYYDSEQADEIYRYAIKPIAEVRKYFICSDGKERDISKLSHWFPIPEL